MIDKSKKNSRSGFNSINATALEAELLNRINKWENIKKEYEQVDLRGAVLVDGHHVFLSIIIEIQNLKKNPESWLKSININVLDKKRNNYVEKLLSTSFANLDPVSICMFYKSIVNGISRHAYQNVYNKIFEDNRRLIFDEHRFRKDLDLFTKAFPPDDCVLANVDNSLFIFDAKQPDKNKLLKTLTTSLNYFKETKKYKAISNIEEFLEILARDQFVFLRSNEDTRVPYDLKDKVLASLIMDRTFFDNKWKLRITEREIDGFSGFIRSREKGVDTNLVIQGCELANNKKIDWVSLVTNDGDHAPLIDYLRSKGKEVYLTALEENKYISKHLKKNLRSEKENILDLKTIFKYKFKNADYSEIETKIVLRRWLLEEMNKESKLLQEGHMPASATLNLNIFDNVQALKSAKESGAIDRFLKHGFEEALESIFGHSPNAVWAMGVLGYPINYKRDLDSEKFYVSQINNPDLSETERGHFRHKLDEYYQLLKEADQFKQDMKEDQEDM